MIPFLHVGLLLQPILLVGMIMTGTTKTIFKTDIGKIMTAFTAWVTLLRAVQRLEVGQLQHLAVGGAGVAADVLHGRVHTKLDDCYRVMYTIALGITAIGVLSLLIGGGQHNDASRLALGSKNDTLADANFLALYLVVGIPFLYFAATWKRGIVRIGLILLVLPLLASLGRTGSRMGLLALGAGLLFFLIFATVPQRVFIVLAGVLCIGLAPFLLPQKIMERFTTFFSAHTAAGEEAAESAAARETMLKRGIQMTMEHPIVGVGPGEFIDAEAKEAAAQGHRGLWRYTHNAYTELSSETGLIGLLCSCSRCFVRIGDCRGIAAGFPARASAARRFASRLRC